MRIALYQGKGFLSRAIQWQTRSKYSHAAFLLDDGAVVEAWVGGVRQIFPEVEELPETCHISALSEQHEPGTVVDIFAFSDPLTRFEKRTLENLALRAVDTPYDYLGILCFLTREKDESRGKVFCSELVFGACSKIGRLLLQRVAPSCVSPGMISLSQLIYREQTITTV